MSHHRQLAAVQRGRADAGVPCCAAARPPPGHAPPTPPTPAHRWLMPGRRYGWRYEARYQGVQYRFSDLDKARGLGRGGCGRGALGPPQGACTCAGAACTSLRAARLHTAAAAAPACPPPGHHGQHRGGQPPPAGSRGAGLGGHPAGPAPAALGQQGGRQVLAAGGCWLRPRLLDCWTAQQLLSPARRPAT